MVHLLISAFQNMMLISFICAPTSRCELIICERISLRTFSMFKISWFSGVTICYLEATVRLYDNEQYFKKFW